MQLAVGAATAALDAGRALATLATERSQGFIDAEPPRLILFSAFYASVMSLTAGSLAKNGGDGHFSFIQSS